MKLKTIPDNIVVHTPTEKEAKELLGFLHENGYSVTTTIREMKMVNSYKDEDICFFIDDENWGHCTREWYEKKGYTILTLSEFKETYCDLDDTCTDDCSSTVQVEKPQPKFREGDLVMFPEMDRPLQIHAIVDGVAMSWWDDGSVRCTAKLDMLKPHTEPETKEKEQGEKGNNSENSQLNLCELLQGHEGEIFFSLAYGEVVLDEIRHGTQRGDSPDFLCVRATSFDSGAIIVNPNGKLRNAGVVDLVPSRALYEQYPLDANAAWMEWHEEQEKHWLAVTAWIDDLECESDTAIDTDKIYFRTPADRDKCIEEIKAVIEKYSR